MAICEKCWSEASARAANLGGNSVMHYDEIIEEKKQAPCSPEEQCGDLHVITSDHGCRCGQVKKIPRTR